MKNVFQKFIDRFTTEVALAIANLESFENWNPVCRYLVFGALFLFIFVDLSFPNNILFHGGTAILLYFFNPFNSDTGGGGACKKDPFFLIDEILCIIFTFSCVFSSLYPQMDWIKILCCTSLYLSRVFVPLKWVFVSLLIARVYFFPEIGFCPFMEVVYLKGLIKTFWAGENFRRTVIAVYFLIIIMVTLSFWYIPGEIGAYWWDVLSHFIFCPISGASTFYSFILALFLLYFFLDQGTSPSPSVKKNMNTSLFLFLFKHYLYLPGAVTAACFWKGGIKAACSSLGYFLFWFLFFKWFYLAVQSLKDNAKKEKSLSIAALFNTDVPQGTLHFLTLYLGLTGIAISKTYNGLWPDFHQNSIIFQTGAFFSIIFFKFKKKSKKVRKRT